jgi:hypothetical protein
MAVNPHIIVFMKSAGKTSRFVKMIQFVGGLIQREFEHRCSQATVAN